MIETPYSSPSSKAGIPTPPGFTEGANAMSRTEPSSGQKRNMSSKNNHPGHRLSSSASVKTFDEVGTGQTMAMKDPRTVPTR